LNEWKLISNINGHSGSTFLYINQPTGTTINPHYSLTGLSNKLNSLLVMVFSGCTYHSSKIINSYIGNDNIINTGTSGFNTSINKTMIIQFVGTFSSGGVSDWSSVPNLTWVEISNKTYTRSIYQIRVAVATSELSPKRKYDNLNYELSSPTENITINIALTPRHGNVSMSMNTL